MQWCQLETAPREAEGYLRLFWQLVYPDDAHNFDYEEWRADMLRDTAGDPRLAAVQALEAAKRTSQ